MTTPTPEGQAPTPETPGTPPGSPQPNAQQSAAAPVTLAKVALGTLASATVDLGEGVTYIGVTTLANAQDPQATYEWLNRIISPDWLRSVFPELQGVSVNVSAVPHLRGWTVEIGALPATPEQAQSLATRLMAAPVDVPVALVPVPPAAAESKGGGLPAWLWAVVGALALAVVGGLIFLLGNANTTPAPEPTATTVSIPSVVGFTVPEATTELQAAGLIVGDIREVPSDQPKGVILEQNPRSGEVVAKNTRVNLTVATTPDPVIPDVVGLSQTDATNALLQAGFRVGTIETQDSPKAAGTVISQAPVAGNTAPKETEVSLVLSTGIINVPPVVGFSEAEATALLQDAGFVVRKQEQESSQVGIVIAQSPQAGSKLEVGKNVVITVGVQAQPTPPPPTPDPAPTGP